MGGFTFGASTLKMEKSKVIFAKARVFSLVIAEAATLPSTAILRPRSLICCTVQIIENSMIHQGGLC